MAAVREMTILGVDPGLHQTGLGLIATGGREIELRQIRLLTTGTSEPLAARLLELFNDMQQALREWKPEVVVVEKLIYARNAQVALKLGHARGVLLLAAAKENKPIAEYTPAEVKRAVTGSGSASKEQVQRMVKAIVHRSRLRSSFDVTDALALAICHAHRAVFRANGIGAKTGATFLARA
jgi:crossover junction endodeoxyribonuclease RuvC